jgi:hypothetical protein
MSLRFEICPLPYGSSLCHHNSARNIKPKLEEENIKLFPICGRCYENQLNGCGRFVSGPSRCFIGLCGEFWKNIFTGDCYTYITPKIIYDNN